MNRIVIDFMIIMGIVVFLPGCNTAQKTNASNSLNEMMGKDYLRGQDASMYDSLEINNSNCSTIIEVFLVAKSPEDSLICSPFLPNRVSDFFYSFPPRPMTYPQVRPIEKSMVELESEIKTFIADSLRFVVQLDFEFHPVMVVFDTEGVPRGLFLFAERDQKSLYVKYGEIILEFLKKEKFEPGIDVEVEIGKPIPDVLELRL